MRPPARTATIRTKSSRPAPPISPLHFSRRRKPAARATTRRRRTWQASVHGKALAAGVRDAPTCTDCHSEHKIESLAGASSRKISEDVCSRCHASERINTKYNLPADRVKTFFDSYHGLAAIRLHGRRQLRQLSRLSQDPAVVGPGLDDQQGPSRRDLRQMSSGREREICAEQNPRGPHRRQQERGRTSGSQINWWVRRIYLLLIFGVIGAMFVHNGLLFLKKVAAHLRTTRPTGAAHEPGATLAACRAGAEFHRAGDHRIRAEVPGFMGGAAAGFERTVPALVASHRGHRAAARRRVSSHLPAARPATAAGW